MPNNLLGGLRPYLGGSLALHGLLLCAFLILVNFRPSSRPSSVYTIDFVGPTAAILSSTGGETAAKTTAAEISASPKLGPQAEINEFSKPRRRIPAALPRPSLLRGYQAPTRPAEESAQSQPAAATGEAGPAGEAGIATDMPNFPYPWYITQVRAALWRIWSSRMPKDPGEALVVFSILSDGGIADLRTESSSGDATFDLAALSTAQDGAPYPPLPQGFSEPFLKIHVTLKSF
ncbi:MAG: TonB family protein [Elusimicrobia bacterium]|nr:TonB family protein [Elusimicrobiota bacterium]